MPNLLEKAIGADNGELATKIIQDALGIESDDVIDYYRFADRLGQPIVSSAPASSARGCRPKH